MRKNIGRPDRIARLGGSVIILFLYFFQIVTNSALLIVLLLFALNLALTSLAGYSPLYRLLGISTRTESNPADLENKGI